MCYSRIGNGVRNGAISTTQLGFINDYYKVNAIGQWGKLMIIGIGLAQIVRQIMIFKNG
jgi:hypothetical protein